MKTESSDFSKCIARLKIERHMINSVMTLLNICGKFMDNSFLLIGLGLSSLLFAYFLKWAFIKVKNCSSSPNNLDEDCGLLLPATRLYCFFFFGKNTCRPAVWNFEHCCAEI